ncbi:alpha/beta hydrolase [Krasilnikovia sp. MM14-A1259]|uniref:alpha/beta hydrolase n=1 Tax=Krasilnikovia sp. MM14-A1259 TaxID=3373539 RepID=UPI00382CD301
MAPDSAGTELVTAVAAILAAAALALFWNRSQGWRRVVLRGASVLACVVTSVAFAGSWVNHEVDFWPSWTSEHDTVPDAKSAAPATGPISAGPVTSTVRGSGRVVSVTVAGPASKLAMPMWVYLPVGYDPAGSLRYPVIEALHGYPGVSAQWLHALNAPKILDREIAAGRMAPTVVLFPQQSPRPLRLDTECTNLVGSAQTETFLTQDVPEYARSHFKVRSDHSGWSLIGFSAGAYCATQLLLRHPNQYAAAASLSGYLDPGIHVGDGSEHTTYNILWRLQHLPVPAVALYLSAARADTGAFAATVAIAKAAHNPLALTTSYINGGGHSTQSWRAMEAPAFDWLSTWLGQPTTEVGFASPL